MTFYVSQHDDGATTFFFERESRFAYVDTYPDGDVYVSTGGRSLTPIVRPSSFPACFAAVRGHVGQ